MSHRFGRLVLQGRPRMELMHILYSYKKVLWTERATIAISAHEVPDTYLERDKGNERVRMPMLSFFRQVF